MISRSRWIRNKKLRGFTFFSIILTDLVPLWQQNVQISLGKSRVSFRAFLKIKNREILVPWNFRFGKRKIDTNATNFLPLRHEIMLQRFLILLRTQRPKNKKLLSISCEQLCIFVQRVVTNKNYVRKQKEKEREREREICGGHPCILPVCIISSLSFFISFLAVTREKRGRKRVLGLCWCLLKAVRRVGYRKARAPITHTWVSFSFFLLVSLSLVPGTFPKNRFSRYWRSSEMINVEKISFRLVGRKGQQIFACFVSHSPGLSHYLRFHK